MKKLQAGLWILVFVFCGCHHRNDATGAKVVPPKDYTIYNPYIKIADTVAALPKGAKIYTLVDVSCSTCILRLAEWDKFQKQIGDRVRIYPVCFSKDKFELLKYLFENNQLAKVQLPLILDKDEQFIRDNKKQISSIGEFNVLADDSNSVLVSGDPLNDQAVREKFIMAIKQL